MLAGCGIGTLDGQIKPHERFSRTGHTCHEADGLAVVGLAVVYDAVDFVGGNGEVLGAGIATGDFMYVVPSIKCLRCFDDGRGGAVLGVFPLYVVKCRFFKVAAYVLNGCTNVVSIAAERFNNTISNFQFILISRCLRGDHYRYQQLIMTFFLKVPQIQSIVVHLVIRTFAVLFVANLELKQEHHVAVQHHGVHPFSHAGNGVLKDDSAVRKSAQLILENRDLRFPCVALLDCRLRRNIVGMDDAEDLSVRLPQKICYCGGVIGS